jgi:hypothetical protein
VSGGSIANAFLSLLRTPDGSEKLSFDSFARGEFDEYAARLALLLSGNRMVWFISVGISLSVVVVSLLLFFLSVIKAPTALVMIGAVLVGISFLPGPNSGGSLWGWWGTWLYCAVLVWLAAAAIVAMRTPDFRLVPFVLGIAGGWLFQQRHWVADLAYDRTVCRPLVKTRRGSEARATLEDMNSAVRHVFCATEMHTGQHAYFSHDVVYARGFGLGRPARLRVSTAVQASANFPGGFPIRPLRTSRFDFFITDRFEDVTSHGLGWGRGILQPDEDVAWAVAHQQFAPTA